MNILHTVSSLGKKSYGLGQISMSLASTQSKLNLDVNVLSVDNSEEELLWSSTKYNFPLEKIRNIQCSYSQILNKSKKNDFIYSLKDLSHIDIVHQHSLWGKHSLLLSEFRSRQIPYIVAPHGTLSPYALRNGLSSRIKKKIALNLYENENLKKCSCLHATSEQEVEDFRQFGLRAPIAYIKNGISEAELSLTGNGFRFKEKYNIDKNKRVLLYLSRITPKKGLDMLLSALNNLRALFNNWLLVIAGNDGNKYVKEVFQMIKDFQLQDKVVVIEPQFDQNKLDIFSAADFFILPSYSEGAPMVILDSLSYGVPVITTKSSSWKDLENFSCGYWADINLQSIELALKNMLDLSTDELKMMSRNSKRLIEMKYTWEIIAQDTLCLYNWLLDKGEKPGFIITY